MLLAIDPGILTGWCVLDMSGVVQVVGKGEVFPTFSNRSAIIECPQVYDKARTKKRVDPNNLITLAVRVGRYQERLQLHGVKTDLVLPTTWKGQIEKFPHHAQVHSRLSEAERKTIAAVAKLPGERAYSEDVWDAVALAKWAFSAKRFAI